MTTRARAGGLLVPPEATSSARCVACAILVLSVERPAARVAPTDGWRSALFSVPELVALTGLHRSTVQRSVRQLRELGWLVQSLPARRGSPGVASVRAPHRA